MKRFLVAIVTLAIVSVAIIIGITLFLSKNDLQGCGDIPDAARQQCAAADAIVAVSNGDTSARMIVFHQYCFCSCGTRV